MSLSFSPRILPAIAVALGWHYGFLITGFIAVGIGIISFTLSKEPRRVISNHPGEPKVIPVSRGAARDVFKGRDIWLVIGGILLGTHYQILNITTTDIGWTLVMFTIITCIFFIGAMRQNTMLSITFLTLVLGLILLDLGNLGGGAVWIKVAAVDLIICAFSAWYMMAHVILAQVNLVLPMGKPWIK